MATTSQEAQQKITLLEEDGVKKEEEAMAEKATRPILGLGLTISSSVLACLNLILYKYATAINPVDQMMIRYIIQLAITFFICKLSNVNCLGPKGQRKLLVIRGFIGISFVIGILVAIQFISASDSVTIINTSIIMTVVLCRIFIKERFSIVHVFAVIMTIAGVVCISRPSFFFDAKLDIAMTLTVNSTNITKAFEDMKSVQKKQIFTAIGVIISLCIAFAVGLSHMFMKKIANAKVHFAIQTFYPAMLCLPVVFLVSLTMIISGYSYTNFESKLFTFHLLVAIAGNFCGAIGVILLGLCFQYEDASKIAIVKSIDIFLLFIFQFLFLKIKADLLGILGAVFVLSGTFFVILFKSFESTLAKSENKLLKLIAYKF